MRKEKPTPLTIVRKRWPLPELYEPGRPNAPTTAAEFLSAEHAAQAENRWSGYALSAKTNAAGEHHVIELADAVWADLNYTLAFMKEEAARNAAALLATTELLATVEQIIGEDGDE